MRPSKLVCWNGEQGIPPQFRPLQWFIISGASKRASEKEPSYYRSMVELGFSSSSDRHQIEVVRLLCTRCKLPLTVQKGAVIYR